MQPTFLLILFSILDSANSTPIKANLEHAHKRHISDTRPSFSTLIPTYTPTGTLVQQLKPSELRIVFGVEPSVTAPPQKVLRSSYTPGTATETTINDYKLL